MTEILKINSDLPEPELIQTAGNLLRQGAICAYPTETFYGLGAWPSNSQGVTTLMRLKKHTYKIRKFLLNPWGMK